MADRYAVADGLWSDTATWDGGTLPTSSDDVYANNYDVRIDQNVAVLSLSNNGNLVGLTNGGSFIFDDGYSVSGNIFCNGLESVLVSSGIQLTSGITIYGNISYSTDTTSTVNAFAFTTVSGDLSVVGDIYVNNGSSWSTGDDTSLYINNNYGFSNVIVSGNISGGTDRSDGISIQNSYINLSVFGDVRGGNQLANVVNQYANGIVGLDSSGNFYITGDIYGGGPYYGYSHGIYFINCAGNMYVVGNIYGGSSVNASYPGNGVNFVNGEISLEITGNVHGASTGSSRGISSTSNGNMSIVGNIYGNTGPAVYNSSSYGNFNLTGNSYGGNVTNAYGFDYSSSGNHYINGSCFGGGNNNSLSSAWGGRIQGQGVSSLTAVGNHKGGRSTGGNGTFSVWQNSNQIGLIAVGCADLYASGEFINDYNTSHGNRYSSCLHIYPYNNSNTIILGVSSGCAYGINNYGVSAYVNSNNCTITMSGDSIGGQYITNGANGNYGSLFDFVNIGANTNNTFNYTGDIYAGGSVNNHGMYLNHLSSLNCSGNIYGATAATASSTNGLYTYSSSGIKIYGNIYGGTASINNVGYRSEYLYSSEINGNIYGGDNSTANYGINYINYPPVYDGSINSIINGDLYTLGIGPAIIRNSTYYQTLTINGNCYASGDHYSIYETTTGSANPDANGRLILNGDIYNYSSAAQPFYYGSNHGYLMYSGAIEGHQLRNNTFFYLTNCYGGVDFIITNEIIQPTNRNILNFSMPGAVIGNIQSNIYGNFKGSDVSNSPNAYAIRDDSSSSSAVVNYYGSYTPGLLQSCIYQNNKSSTNIYGILNSGTYPVAGAAAYAYYNNSASSLTGITRLSKCISNNFGFPPYHFQIGGFYEFMQEPSGSYWQQTHSSGDASFMTFDGESIASYPVESDVRSGVLYRNETSVGTLIVPNSGSVAYGVPVDDTVGTAVLSASTIQDLLQSALQPNAPIIVERSIDDEKDITFSWPVSGATITVEKSVDNGAYTATAGAVSFLRQEGTRYYYVFGYNASDRFDEEGVIRYKFSDGTYTKYLNLRLIAPSSVEIDIQATADAIEVDTQDIQSRLTTLQNKANDIETDTQNIQSRIPTALVAGRMDSNVGAMSADTITSTALASSAVVEIQTGLATSASLDQVNTTVDNIESDTQDIQSRLPAALNNGKMDAKVTEIATDAITAASLSTDAVEEIQNGLVTSEDITSLQNNAPTEVY